jgi:hypothetical protein
MLVGCGCHCPTFDVSGSGPSGSDRGSSGVGSSDETAGSSVAPAICGACSALPREWSVAIDGNWFDSYFFDQPPFGDGPFREGVQDCRSVWTKSYTLRPYGREAMSRAAYEFMYRLLTLGGGEAVNPNWQDDICTVWQSDDRATLWPKYRPNGTSYPFCPTILAVPRVEMISYVAAVGSGGVACPGTGFVLFFWVAKIPGRLGNDFAQTGFAWHFSQERKIVPLPVGFDCLPVVCIRNYGADWWQQAGDFYWFGSPYFLKQSEQSQWDTIPVLPV